MRRRRTTRSAIAAPGDFADIMFGTMGLVLVLLIWALTQIGIPDVSRATLEAMSAKFVNEQRAREAAEEAVLQEGEKRASAERALESESRKRAQSELARAAAEEVRKRAEKESEKSKAARKRAEKERAQAEASRREAEEKLLDEQAAKSALEAKPCDVVIVLDGTASQDPVIDALQSGALVLSEIGARLSPRFRLGLVIYHGDGVSMFPPIEITETVSGEESAGMRSVRTFLEDVGTVKGSADVEAGVTAALSMLRNAGGPGSRQLLALLGDVGPWEGSGDANIQPEDRESAARIRAEVESFAQANAQNRVLALFTGKNHEVNNRDATISFFEGVAQAAGARGTYSDDVSQLSATIVEALFGQ